MSFTKNLIENIKAEAVNLGFSNLGVTNPQSLKESHRYLEWLDHGYNGSMDYLARQDSISRRLNPSLLLENCKTIITLAYSYPIVHFSELSNSSTKGWISSYAIFDDYHFFLKKLALQLVEKIRDLNPGNHAFQVFTDSAPILERECGVRGSLGWIGKNANLISPVLGSTFFLAEILTDIEINTDVSIPADRCGKCRRCIDACPTQCILPDRTLDARKCISYLTIENKGAIPFHLRDKMDHWVFGCDICQMVCPWNGSYKKESHIKIKKRINPLVDITSQLHFSEKEFQDFYAGTPVIRTGLNGFIRNLIVVAGNLVDSRVEKDLTRFLLNASDPMIRSHSGWALGKYHTANAREVLCRSLTSESDQTVLDEIHLALG